MYKIIISLSLFASLSSAGCSWIPDLGGVVLADGGVDSELADGSVDSAPGARNYWCGYAMPGFNCDNGRSHVVLIAPDMTSGIAMCGIAKPMANLDSCHVIDLDGAAPTDAPQCAAAAGSWRPGNNCCNFKGTLSCP
jgi:hypothetical protein